MPLRTVPSSLPCVLWAILLASTCAAADSQPAALPRPQLQILNGSDQSAEIFWLKTADERISNGTLAAGEQSTITTTLGHRFAIVGVGESSEVIVTSKAAVQGVRFAPPDPDGIPAFYTQRVSAGGFPIVASATVNPHALQEAKYLVNQMLAHRPDLRKALIDSGARMCILAYDEFTTDLPEFYRLGQTAHSQFPQLDSKDYWDARARGTGGSRSDPFCSTGEENLLGYPGDPYAAECILIHEFAHCIHLRGLVNVDPSFDGRLQAAYDRAMESGLWKGKYASVNHHEYFAEGVQSWFDDNRENDHDHNHVNTRAELRTYDPALADLCQEVFGETAIRYTKPATRLSDHLAGYDPATAPRFVWPARLQHAQQVIRQHAQQRGAPSGSHQQRNVAGWTLHIHNDLLLPDARPATLRAVELLRAQLEEIVRVVPSAAVEQLQQVPLWFSPEYDGVQPRAEYHPGAQWLRDNQRDPAMAKAVEFTNIIDFEAEMRRMPNFALHELAHAFHDRVLPQGFANEPLKAAYEKAKAGGSYERVERQNAEGETSLDRAYALTNPQEYFAETSEAFFSRNDFFPYTRAQLQRHDPEIVDLLSKLWGVGPKK